MELNKEQLEALQKSADIIKQLVKDAYAKFHSAQQAHSLTGKAALAEQYSTEQGKLAFQLRESNRQILDLQKALRDRDSSAGRLAQRADSFESAYNKVVIESAELQKEVDRLRDLNDAFQQDREKELDTIQRLEAELQTAGKDYRIIFSQTVEKNDELITARSEIKRLDGVVIRCASERNKLEILLAAADMERANQEAHNHKLNKALVSECLENKELKRRIGELTLKGAQDGNVEN